MPDVQPAATRVIGNAALSRLGRARIATIEVREDLDPVTVEFLIADSAGERHVLIALGDEVTIDNQQWRVTAAEVVPLTPEQEDLAGIEVFRATIAPARGL